MGGRCTPQLSTMGRTGCKCAMKKKAMYEVPNDVYSPSSRGRHSAGGENGEEGGDGLAKCSGCRASLVERIPYCSFQPDNCNSPSIINGSSVEVKEWRTTATSHKTPGQLTSTRPSLRDRRAG
ncbi:uncharacterized protein MCYG_08040 [Microsporum canis CBS 113480]|uniref:Uncharacterized protein n=1 Tax=Arthroderma otae (strain ATCC MYA-4605 / CBS 113480) TaxID=554155 RepID=C5FZB8_ARTOC|nr:uncharacterized protein MCYG_08040 [Microsporum canis CBS 113480]EEQ35221.1 predicted protein [Microsporum canis CBS 113480]